MTVSSLRRHDRQHPQAIVPQAWINRACSLLRSEAGPLYCAALPLGMWVDRCQLVGERWLAVGFTNRYGLPCGVFVVTDVAFDGLGKLAPDQAAWAAQTWLKYRLVDEAASCPQWSPDLPCTLAILPDHQQPKGANHVNGQGPIHQPRPQGPAKDVARRRLA